MAENTKTPAIRFAGFTDAWEQRKVQDVADRFDNLRIPVAANLRVHGTTPYYGANGIQDFVEGFTHDGEFVLVAEDGANDLKNYPVKCVNGRIWVNNHAHVLQGKAGIADNSFLAFAISQSDIESLLVGGGRAKLNTETLMSIEFRLPCLQEQYRIGEYLTQLDHLITLHQRKCEKLQNIKKSMLEKMFPKNGSNVPEIRFKGFTDAWEQRKLVDFGKATGGTSIESEFSEDGIYKVISIGSYSENSVYNDQGIRAIKSDKTSNRVLNKNDLTMILNDKTTSGNIIGRVLLIEKSGIYVYNQRTERIEINKNEYDSLFLYEMLNAPNIREKIIKQAQGNTQIYVNWSAIAMLDYMVPSKKEQAEIGQFLHRIGTLITLHQRKLKKLQNIKTSMLEKMFI